MSNSVGASQRSIKLIGCNCQISLHKIAPLVEAIILWYNIIDYAVTEDAMSFSLIPNRVFDRYSDVTAKMLTDRGIKLLLCDLDYTLAPRAVAVPDTALRRWLDEMRAAGITVMILSNNRSGERVNTFCKDLGISYVGHAGKPSRRGYREAIKKAGVTAAQTAMLGDKLLTDVLGAKRSGVLALMVEPLGGPVGAWNHVLHLLQRPFKYISKRRTKHEQI